MAKETNKEKALSALLSTTSIEDAAKKAKLGKATIYRYLADDDFNALYRKARRGLVENTIGRIQTATGEAVETLQRNLACGVPSSEIRAAQIILEMSYKGIEILDFAERLEALEAAQTAQ